MIDGSPARFFYKRAMTAYPLVLVALLPLAASAQQPEVDAGVDLEALVRRVGALEAELAQLKTPDAGTPAAPPEAVPLDVSEPPFSLADWSWMNGSNYQPASLLRIGPVTPTFFVDADYAWQFSNPVDHTIFPTTTAARHSEFSLNLAYLGFELNGIDTKYGGPIGRIELQMGSYIATIHGQDSTLSRGFFLSNPTLSYVKQAGAGWQLGLHAPVRLGLHAVLFLGPAHAAVPGGKPEARAVVRQWLAVLRALARRAHRWISVQSATEPMGVIDAHPPTTALSGRSRLGEQCGR